MTSKILVIDDSALMRRKIAGIIETDRGYEVRTARDGQDGFEQARDWQPDAITLDINMPVMDGLTCLGMIKEVHDCPVIMLSSLTKSGAMATFEAIELGAFDYIPKPGGTISANIESINQIVLDKLAIALKRSPKPRKPLYATPSASLQRASKPRRYAGQEQYQAFHNSGLPGVIVIGVSTGGPATLEAIIRGIPAQLDWPILIAQHMPSGFTQVFAKRLQRSTPLDVVHVDKPQVVEGKRIYIARGDGDMVLSERRGKLMAIPCPEGNYHWHPSVERLVSSVFETIPAKHVIGVQLTGMGDDGAAAFKQLHSAGARTIAEAEASAVVFGMSRALIELGGATCVLNNSDIARQILDWTL